ncbi:MAG: MFS transporter [Cellulosilyticaceae bacterium]
MNPQQAIHRYSLAYMINTFGGNLLTSTFVLLLSQTKGFSPGQVSIIIGVTPLLIIPGTLFWGKLMDKYKRLVLAIKVVLLLNAFSMLVLCLIGDFKLFFIVNLIRGLLLQPAGGAGDEYMLNLSIKCQTSYGRLRVFGTIGFGIGGIIAPLCISIGGVLGPILLGAFFLIVAFFLYNPLPEYARETLLEEQSTHPDPSPTKPFDFSIFKNKQFLFFLFIGSAVFGTLQAAAGYGSQLLLIELGAPDEIIGSLSFVMIVFEMFMLSNIHKFKASKKPYLLYTIGLVILCIRWLITAFVTNYIILLLTITLHGLVVGMILSAQNQLIGILVKPNEQSTAFLVNSTCILTIVPSILNLVTGDLVERFGYSVFGFTYLGFTLIALGCLLPKVIREFRESSPNNCL